MDADGVDSSGLGSEDDVADSSRPGSAAPVDGIDDAVAVDGVDSSGLGSDDDVADGGDSSGPGSADPVDGIDDEVAVDGDCLLYTSDAADE